MNWLKYASSMLLDPEYGLPATKALMKKLDFSLLMKKQVMTRQAQNACQTALDVWSAKRIKEEGADAVKFLLYYDVDSSRRT